eukprot:1723620-Rhodomonas_salina.2
MIKKLAGTVKQFKGAAAQVSPPPFMLGPPLFMASAGMHLRHFWRQSGRINGGSLWFREGVLPFMEAALT